MNSPEAQYQLAKKMPTASLANILRGIPGAIDQGIAMMVLGERQRMKTASQGQQAGAEAQQPSVKDRMLLAQQGQLPENQGIGTLPSPNMGQVADVAMGAQGGVVGFAGGGDVQHFQVGGDTWRQKQRAVYPSLFDRYRDPEALNKYNAAIKGEQYTPSTEGFVTAPGQIGISKEDILSNNPTEEGLTQLAGPQGDVAAPVSTGRSQSEAAPVSASGIKLLQTQPALPMTDYSTSPDVPASPSAAAAPTQPTAPAGGIKALGLASDFEAAQKMTNDSTKPYMDEMTKLVKGLNLSAGEKENQKYTRLGNTFLSAAQELLTSGRPGASSIGAALGKVGTLAQDYAKEDKAERKAAIGAEISMLGAHAQMAQGNTKTAIEFYQNAQKMAFDGIRFDAEKVFKQEELRLTKEGLDEKKAHNQATEASKKYQTDMEAKWKMAHIGVLGATQKGIDQRADTAATKQFIDSQNAILKNNGPFSKEGKAATEILKNPKLIKQGALELRGNLEMGLGAVPPTSVQKLEVNPADVFKVN